VFKEKVELLNITLKNSGKVFINNDDPILKSFGKTIKNKITYAVDEKADYQAVIKKYDELGRPLIEIKYGKNIAKINLPVSGEKNVSNYLAAFAVASELGMKSKDIINATAKIRSYNKRLEIKKTSKFTLINDTYNANPDSMKSSLNLLTKIENKKKKVAVLGDMFELGKESKSKHLELAETIIKLNLDEVYSIGKMMKLLDKKLNGKIKTHCHFKDRESLNKSLQDFNLNNSVILIKGSRGMKMEEFVETILNKKR
jgi:UDP-N-acetylmuramoyl-tripeptide--D-alanyl-D-alanine ligase